MAGFFWDGAFGAASEIQKNFYHFYFIFDCRNFFLSLNAKSIHTIYRMDRTSLHQLIDIQRCQTPELDVVSFHFSHNRFVNGVSPCA